MSVVLRFGKDGQNGRPSSLSSHIRASIRHALADEIDRLLNLIDVLDGDPDLEPPGDDEPSLGWTSTMAHGTTDDAEQGEVSP